MLDELRLGFSAFVWETRLTKIFDCINEKGALSINAAYGRSPS